MKKNRSVIANGCRFMMGGGESISREEALREARLVWQFAEVV